MAAGYVVGHLLLEGLPAESWQRVLWVAVAGLAAGWIAAWRRSAAVRGALVVPLALLVAWLLLPTPSVPWVVGATVGTAALIAVLLGVAATAGDDAHLPSDGPPDPITSDPSLIGRLVDEGTLTQEEARRIGGRNVVLAVDARPAQPPAPLPTLPAVVAVVGLATAVSLERSGWIRLALLAGALTSATAATGFLARRLVTSTAAPLAGAVLGAFLLSAVRISEMPLATAALLALAPLGGLLPDRVLPRGGWKPLLARGLVVAAIAGAAVAVAVANAPSDG